MGAVLALGFLTLTGVFVVATIMTLAFVLKMILRLVLLPLLLVKFLVMGLLMLIVGPIMAVVGPFVIGVLAIAFALPLLPLLAVVALVWFLSRSNRRPAVA